MNPFGAYHIKYNILMAIFIHFVTFDLTKTVSAQHILFGQCLVEVSGGFCIKGGSSN